MANVLADTRSRGGLADATPRAPEPLANDLDHHRRELAQKQQTAEDAYVSPSDGMLSPCSERLAAMRQKKTQRLGGGAQGLFKRRGQLAKKAGLAVPSSSSSSSSPAAATPSSPAATTPTAVQLTDEEFAAGFKSIPKAT